MADKLTPAARSANMSRIRSKNTKPELAVRRLLSKLGYRYRLHRRDLPGKPDLVFSARRKVVLVHGCFWHGHDADDCPDRRAVKSNTAYWGSKIEGNIARDQRNSIELSRLGWSSLTLWECELRNETTVANRLTAFLGETRIRDK